MIKFLNRIFEMPPPLIQKGDLFAIYQDKKEGYKILEVGKTVREKDIPVLESAFPLHRVKRIKSIREIRDRDKLINSKDGYLYKYLEENNKPNTFKNLGEWFKVIPM